jgi:two-component system, OmpR family, sensor histidine kinase MprB
VRLRSRLALGTACTLALVVTVGFAVAYLLVRGQLEGQVDSSLRERARTFSAVPRGAETPTRPLPRPARFRLGPAKLGAAAGYFELVDANGKVSLPPGEHTRLPVRTGRAVAGGRSRDSFSDATVSGTHVRIYTVRAAAHTAAEIALPLTDVDQALARIRLLFLLVSLAALAGGAVLGLAVSRTTLRPVARLTEDVEQIRATGNLRVRTDARRRDELGRLASAFNGMLDALARSVGAQRQLVADASHELRTPLASARANLELVELHETLPAPERQRLIGDAAEELREMTHLIEELVELAHGDAQEPRKEPVRLDHLAQETVAAATRRSSATFRTRLEPSVVQAAPGALGRAISNLVDNAVKWSAPGSVIEVTVARGVVTVRDHGPGIDDADLSHVFDRFYRAPSARALPGSGLGLAIVRQVAEAHGGSVSAENAEGGGSRFSLRLPGGELGSAT